MPFCHGGWHEARMAGVTLLPGRFHKGGAHEGDGQFPADGVEWPPCQKSLIFLPLS